MADDTKDLDDDIEDDTDSEDDKELLRIAKERFDLCVEHESHTRDEELDDLKFMVGQQWPIEERNERQQNRRPCLTINRLPQFVRQITNENRQNRPSIKINPVDNGATIDTAKVLQGMVRHIENRSHADIAYDNSLGWAAKVGLGYFRLRTDYATPFSFQKEILIEQVKNRFCCYLDPWYQQPDGSDSIFGFITEEMSEYEFKNAFPKAKMSEMADWSSLGDDSSLFINKDSCKVAEYYYKTWEEVDIVQLTSGKVIEKSLLEKVKLPDHERIVKERKSLVPKIKWAKITGFEVLEKADVLGRWIPIIPVIGEEDVVEGKKIVSGIIRHAKDSQRMYNYSKSAQAEIIGLAPKAPFIVAEGQIEGFEKQWETANVKNWAYLQYKLKSLAGVPAPPPQRTNWEPPVQALTASASENIEEMKGTTGLYDDNLGNRSNAQSGVAIQRRTSQGQTSNFHFTDNLSKSMRHAGEIMVNWIPQIYNESQVVRTLGDDGEVTMVQINQVFKENEVEKSHFLDLGTYDVTVDTGPSYQTKRQEAVASMIDFTRVAPQFSGGIADLMVGNMDWPMAKECAARIKKMIPPNITDDGKEEIPPQAKAQMSQMNQMVSTLSKQNAELIGIIKNKRIEMDSKERIESNKNRTDLVIEAMKHQAKDSQMVFEAEYDRINQQIQRDSDDLAQTLGAAQAAPGGGQSNTPTGGSSPGQPMGAQ